MGKLKRIFLSFVLLSFIASLCITISSCSQKPEEKKEDVIKIGAILPLTGNLGFMGGAEKKGMLVAERLINQKDNPLGRKLKIVFEDSMAKPQEGVTAANKLLNIENIKYIITSTTGVSRAVASLLQKSKFLQAAYCMDPSIQKESRYLIRLYYGMDQEATTILEYFKSLINKKVKDISKGVAILYVQHAGAEQQLRDYFLPGFKKLGINVVYSEPYQFTQKDFKENIIKIKDSGAKYLVLVGYGFVYPTIFKQLEEMHMRNKLNIVGGWGFIAQKNLPKNQLENVIVAIPNYIVHKNKVSEKFMDRYKQVYGAEPNFDSALAFENIWLIAMAMKDAKSTNIDKVINSLLDHSYEGVMGKIFIDKNGALIIPMSLGIFKQGKIVELKL